jgi:hypothetical protein
MLPKLCPGPDNVCLVRKGGIERHSLCELWVPPVTSWLPIGQFLERIVDVDVSVNRTEYIILEGSRRNGRSNKTTLFP